MTQQHLLVVKSWTNPSVQQQGAGEMNGSHDGRVCGRQQGHRRGADIHTECVRNTLQGAPTLSL